MAKCIETNRDVTGKLQDILVLRYLDLFRKRYTSIAETVYLSDFAELDTVAGGINPKYIIRNTLINFLESAREIYKQPECLHKLIFTFHDKRGNLCKFEFSNNMYFNEDILIICFIYLITYEHSDLICDTVKILTAVLENKYDIGRSDANNTQCKVEEYVTFGTIAFTYLSISLDIGTNLKFPESIHQLLSEFGGIPKQLFFPAITVCLPLLREFPPIALCMLVLLYRTHCSSDRERLIYEVYRNVREDFAYTLFPKRMKIELCEKWKIIIKDGDIYKYSPNIVAYRQKAKDLIANIRSNDPDLNRVLSMI